MAHRILPSVPIAPIAYANASAAVAANPSPKKGHRVFLESQMDTYTFDGTYWRNAAAGKYVPSGAPAGSFISGFLGTATGTTSAAGVLAVNFGQVFATAPDFVLVSPGSQGASSNVRYYVPNSANHTSSTINITVFGGSGTTINAAAVRVHYHVIGYN